MKYLITTLSLLATFAAAGQTTNPFPYNPDVDADGWISVNDLLSLLAIFTTEFTPESWETDSLSAAVVLNGNISYFECQRACHELEGHWRMADMDAFGKHWNLVAGENANHWVNSNSSLGSHDYNEFFEINGNGSIYSVSSSDLSLGKKCMCHLQSSPFVPDVLTSETAGLQEQIDSLYAEQAAMNTAISNIDSVMQGPASSPQYSIECVEMGGSLLCPQGIGWAPWVTLGPSSSDGYSYSISTTQSINEDNLLNGPLWRKFRLNGVISEEPTVQIVLQIQATGSQGTNMATGEAVREGDDYYFYCYGTRYGCAGNWNYNYEPCCEEEGVPLSIPIEYGFHVKGTSISGGGWHHEQIQIYIEQEGSLKDTGVFFRIS